jgi:ribosomal protein L30E
MTRIKQNSNGRGSLKCIQHLINEKPKHINSLITTHFPDLANDNISWLSPLKDDDFAEYKDYSFLHKIGATSSSIQLKDFWPKSGPQWDALAKTKSGKVILVEAKANISEIKKSGTKAKEVSKNLIKKSLSDVKQYLEITNDVDWSSTYYQYTNRIAHLFYLRERCKIPAYLINIYFVNDKTHIATKREKFEIALKKLKKHLGVSSHKLDNYMMEAYIDLDLI